jgi:hypothetical protein
MCCQTETWPQHTQAGTPATDIAQHSTPLVGFNSYIYGGHIVDCRPTTLDTSSELFLSLAPCVEALPELQRGAQAKSLFGLLATNPPAAASCGPTHVSTNAGGPHSTHLYATPLCEEATVAAWECWCGAWLHVECAYRPHSSTPVQQQHPASSAGVLM